MPRRSAEETSIQHPRYWRFTVRLRDGRYAQDATIDFCERERLDVQLVQLTVTPDVGDRRRALYEFTNEAGEVLAFRAAAYDSHTVTALGEERRSAEGGKSGVG